MLGNLTEHFKEYELCPITDTNILWYSIFNWFWIFEVVIKSCFLYNLYINSVLGMTNCIQWESSSSLALGIVEYLVWSYVLVSSIMYDINNFQKIYIRMEYFI